MMLVVYDIARQGPRQRVERVLRAANFVYLFRNARWTDHHVETGPLKRRLLATLRGEAFRVLMLDVPQRSVEGARWLHGSAAKVIK